MSIFEMRKPTRNLVRHTNCTWMMDWQPTETWGSLKYDKYHIKNQVAPGLTLFPTGCHPLPLAITQMARKLQRLNLICEKSFLQIKPANRRSGVKPDALNEAQLMTLALNFVATRAGNKITTSSSIKVKAWMGTGFLREIPRKDLLMALYAANSQTAKLNKTSQRCRRRLNIQT